MSHPGAAHADGVRRIEILSVSWERIQITFRFRPTDDRPLDPATIRLVARFNVIQGPDQAPLTPGRRSVVAIATRGGSGAGGR